MHKIDQIGIMQLTDEEFEILVQIFMSFKENTMLSSAYIGIENGWGNTLISDAMITEMSRIISNLSPEHPWFVVIDKILEFRSHASLVLE